MKFAKTDKEVSITVPTLTIEIPMDDAVPLLQELIRVKKASDMYSEEVASFIDGFTRAIND